MKHQVFIERCRDSKPETAILLAKAIAKKYGIDPEQILSRLKEGSFRVKANLDFAEAREFMSYLEKEGALCRVVDDKGATVAQSSALIVTIRGKPAKGTSTMQESAEKDSKAAKLASTLTMEPQKLATELPLHTPPPPPDGDYESGLSAAYSSSPSNQDLGSLNDEAGISSASLRLETLDGSSAEEEEKKPSSSVADTSDAAAFLPPDMVAEKNLELDMEPEAGPALPEATATPAPDPGEAQEPSKSARISAVQEAQDDQDDEEVEKAADKGPKTPPHEFVLTALSGSERLRFTVGVFLAVFIGFGVVSLVASSREASKYSPIVAELNVQYETANTTVAWNGLDDARATALETLEVRRRGIVIMSIFVWLAVGGLFAFLWLRVIDWTRWEEVVSDGAVQTPAPS